MSKWGTFLSIARIMAPLALSFTPLAPIAGPVAAAIGEAEQIEGASNAQKLEHVTTIAVQAAHAANDQAGRLVLDPALVQAAAATTISAVVDSINLVRDVHAAPAA